MKTQPRPLLALLLLVLASLACFNTPNADVLTYGRVTCKSLERDIVEIAEGRGDYECSCPSAPKNVFRVIRAADLKGKTTAEMEAAYCEIPTDTQTSEPPAAGSAATELPVEPSATPTHTPLPPPEVSGVTACDFAARYVNIEMQTDASYDPQAFNADFKTQGVSSPTSCQLVNGSSTVYTCSIPETVSLPATLQLSYQSQSFFTFDLNASNCTQQSPQEPQPDPSNSEVPTPDCTVTPFPAGCK